MNERDLSELLEAVRSGSCEPDEAAARLRSLPFADLGFARVDHHRELRTGLVEAVYAPGKTPRQCADIVDELLARGSGPVLLTRADERQVAEVLERCPDGIRTPKDTSEASATNLVSWRPAPTREGHVVVLTAGTADLAVANECIATLSAYGFSPELLADCGVAGVHRLFASLDVLEKADVVIVIAGMEGALASIVGGITSAPLIAVPTSVGYGASLEGVTALLAMLASCAAGITVVGIDNGFGAGVRGSPHVAMTDSETRSDHGRVAWFHCFAGIAGDMSLASLIDAGASFDTVREMLERLAIRGWSIEPEPVLRCGIAATYLRFEADGDDVIRTFPAMRALINDAQLPARVRDRSIAAFRALAQVEARLHRRDPERVHFHELAGYDTVLDIVGTMAALEVLGVDEVFSSAVATGSGMVRTEHGHLPNPAPAVLELLVGAPLYGRDVNVELTTPTGAAILNTLVAEYGPLPAMNVEATGYGAGARELDGLPNCTQVVIGTRQMDESRASTDPSGQPLILLEANLDDATGEQLADTVTALLEAGAADAWVTPILMKKGRPGHLISVLGDLALSSAMRAILVGESGTLGVRSHVVDRWAASRTTDVVEFDGHRVRVKVSPGRLKIEHDDAARVAREIGKPVREVIVRAERAWHDRHLTD